MSPTARLQAALLLLVLSASTALAHGDDAPAYDPLVVDLHAHLTAEGRLVEVRPDLAAIPFPAPVPPAEAAALRFTFPAPVRFAPASGFEVELTLRADRALVPRDAEGNAVEIAIDPGGAPVRVGVAQPLLAPGDVVTLRAKVQASTTTYEKGREIALTIRPLMPGLTEGSLALLVGGEAPSRLDVRDMRIPALLDLELQDEPLAQFLLATESFGVPAHVVRVGHASATLDVFPNASYVVLAGEETGADADAHAYADRERRVAAAHAYQVNGVLARVHPGVGVIVRIGDAPARVVCVKNCPPGGFSQAIAAGATTGSPTTEDRPSVLIPPPRDTSGIPVSRDEPQKQTPLGLVAPLALLVALLGRRR